MTIAALGGATAHDSPSTSRRWVGVSVASRALEIGPEQSGAIAEFPVVEGQRVTKGQVLFRLTSDYEALDVKRLESRVASAKTSVKKAESDLRFAEREEVRLRGLAKQGIGADRDLEDKIHETEKAKLDLDKARQEHAELIHESDQARSKLAQRTVKSPLTGIVTKKHKDAGEPVERLTPVIEVIRLDPLWVEFECPVEDEKRFPVGTQVLVRPAAGSAAPRRAKVVFASMKANPSSHTFRVRLAVPNPKHDWKAGLKSYVELPGK